MDFGISLDFGFWISKFPFLPFALDDWLATRHPSLITFCLPLDFVFWILRLKLYAPRMQQTTLTLGHSPDPDDAFMFYGLAKGLVPSPGYRFEHILQDIQTLNERATRGELDISAVSIHAYAHVSDQYALLPTGASMGDGYGPMLVAPQRFTKEEVARQKIAVPGTMTSAFLALQLWLGKPAAELDYMVVPFDQIFATVRRGGGRFNPHFGQRSFKTYGMDKSKSRGRHRCGGHSNHRHGPRGDPGGFTPPPAFASRRSAPNPRGTQRLVRHSVPRTKRRHLSFAGFPSDAARRGGQKHGFAGVGPGRAAAARPPLCPPP